MCGTALRLLCPVTQGGRGLPPPVPLSHGGFLSRALAPFHGFTSHSVSWVKGWVECTDFITSVLGFYEEKGWCMISQKGREGNRKRICSTCASELMSEARKSRQASSCILQPHLSLLLELSESFAFINTWISHHNDTCFHICWRLATFSKNY